MAMKFDDASLNHSLQLREFHCELTLIHIPSGKGNNQQGLLSPNGYWEFGDTVVNDWKLQQGGKIVGYAKGLHIQASKEPRKDGQSWHCSFDIVFTEGSGWEGSTLQVMGRNVSDGEWSIVGGTGKLTMARGVIYKNLTGGNERNVQIHAFYIPMLKRNASHPSGAKNVWSW